MSNGKYIDELVKIARSGTPEADMRAQFERVIAAHETDVLRCLSPDFEIAAANPSGLKLPDPDPSGKTYVLYKDRPFIQGSKKRRILATEHLKNEWQQYLDAGLLNSEALRKLDADLVQALYNQESYERRKKGTTWKVDELLETRFSRAQKEDLLFAHAPGTIDRPSLRYSSRILNRAHRQRKQTQTPDFQEPATPSNE